MCNMVTLNKLLQVDLHKALWTSRTGPCSSGPLEVCVTRQWVITVSTLLCPDTHIMFCSAVKSTTVQQRKAAGEVTDSALGESQLFLDIEHFGRVWRDGLQEGFPMDHDPDTQHTKIQYTYKKS